MEKLLFEVVCWFVQMGKVLGLAQALSLTMDFTTPYNHIPFGRLSTSEISYERKICG